MKTNYNTIELNVTNDKIESLKKYIAKIEKKISPTGIFYSLEDVQKTIKNKVIDLINVKITIDIPVLKFEGWKYYGTIKKVILENQSFENMLYSNIENNDILNNYKDLDFLNCDHCKTSHQRKKVHLFVHDDSRQFVIGTSCAKEYFGINVYNKLSNILSLYRTIEDMEDDIEREYRYSSSIEQIDKSVFCKIVQYLIHEKGRYISKNSIDEFSLNNETPTANQASEIYNARPIDNYGKELCKLRNDILKMDIPDLMPEIKEYWLKKDDCNNFVQNIQVTLKMINPSEGFLTYAIWEYMKEILDFTGKNKVKNRLKDSHFLGVQGEKLNGLMIEVYNCASFETQYGIMNIISMIDQNNNVLIWKTSTKKVEKGDKKTIKIATIKEHKEYKTVKQTVIKNVKFQ